MEAIDGATFVAVQPGAVCTKRDEVSKWSVGVVPHDEDPGGGIVSQSRCCVKEVVKREEPPAIAWWY